MFAGIFTTLCIPETKRISLEVLSGENWDEETGSGSRSGNGNAGHARGSGRTSEERGKGPEIEAKSL